MSVEEKARGSEKIVPEAENASPVAENRIDGNSKQSFRKHVWEYLEKNKLVNFPRPAFGRIPNFKGAEKAAANLLELEEFKAAKSVEVNPDKPLEFSRSLVVENDKILYVPIPQLQEGLLKKISFCNDDKPKNIKQTVTRWGIETLGKPVDFGDDVMHIDLLVLGSVAVSKDGHRIGKGKGFTDLEYAILKEMKAVSDETIIVTTVHDSQVFDSLPDEIFEKHDVPLDYILTPTQIIKVEKKLPRPEGIYWDLLSQRRLNLMPVLQKIKQAHSSEGKETTLKEVDTDVENEVRRRPAKIKKFQPRPKSEKVVEENGTADDTSNQLPRRRRYFKRSSSPQKTNENEDPGNKENEEAQAMKKKSKPFRRSSRRLQVDFSLVVSNIDKNVRVRHLKDALIDHGIKPNNITWRGYKGFCYLHYAKPLKEDKVDEEKPFAVDNVIEILQTLKLNPESENNLSVKVMEPITRIETTDVTAV